MTLEAIFRMRLHTDLFFFNLKTEVGLARV